MSGPSDASLDDNDLGLFALVVEALESLGIRFNAMGSTFTFAFEHEGHETLYTCVARGSVLTLAALWIIDPDERQIRECQDLAGEMDELSFVYTVRPFQDRPCLFLQAKTRLPEPYRDSRYVEAWLRLTLGELLETHRELEAARLG